LKLSSSSPIGVFDSGVGGLSVLRHVHQQLPHENLVYVADSQFAPYGEKGEAFVIERALCISRFLVDLPVKALVVACNTATAAAVAELRKTFPVPIVGIEPGVKPAVCLSKTGVVGVLATRETVSSEKYARLVSSYGGQEVITQPCPGLVDEIEAMNFDGQQLRSLLTRYLAPMLEAQVDTLVLGCTHYSFIAPLIQEISGPGVRLVDTGAPVAAELSRRLRESGLLGLEENTKPPRFYTSAPPIRMKPIFAHFWGETAEVLPLP
jgi:glutamate racemase